MDWNDPIYISFVCKLDNMILTGIDHWNLYCSFIVFFVSFKYVIVSTTHSWHSSSSSIVYSHSNIRTSCNYFLQLCVFSMRKIKEKAETETKQNKRADPIWCRVSYNIQNRILHPLAGHPLWEFALHLTLCRISNFIWIVCVRVFGCIPLKIDVTIISCWNFSASNAATLLCWPLYIRMWILHYNRMCFFLRHSENIHFNVSSILHLNSIFRRFRLHCVRYCIWWPFQMASIQAFQ